MSEGLPKTYGVVVTLKDNMIVGWAINSYLKGNEHACVPDHFFGPFNRENCTVEIKLFDRPEDNSKSEGIEWMKQWKIHPELPMYSENPPY